MKSMGLVHTKNGLMLDVKINKIVKRIDDNSANKNKNKKEYKKENKNESSQKESSIKKEKSFILGKKEIKVSPIQKENKSSKIQEKQRLESRGVF